MIYIFIPKKGIRRILNKNHIYLKYYKMDKLGKYLLENFRQNIKIHIYKWIYVYY